MEPEEIAILSLLVTVVAAVVGAAIGIWSVRTTRAIARESGSLDAPELHLHYGGIQLDGRERPLDVVYGLDASKERRVAQLPIIIANQGRRAAENVKLEVVVPAGANSGSEVLEFTADRGVMPGISRECFRSGELLHVYYLLPVVNPGENILISEPFWIETTMNLPWETTATSADGVRLSVEGRFSFAFAFDFNLLSKESPPLSTRLKVSALSAANVQELARGVATEQASEEPRSIRSIVRTLLSKEAALLTMPKFDELKPDRNKTLYWENYRESDRWWLIRTRGRWTLEPARLPIRE